MGHDPVQFCADLHDTWQMTAVSPSSLSYALPVLTFNTSEWYLVQGWTLLHTAARWGGPVELLVARGADINAKDCEVSQHWGLLAFT